MKGILPAVMGLILMGAVVGPQAEAQGVGIDIRKGNKSISIRTGDSARSDRNFRDNSRRQRDRDAVRDRDTCDDQPRGRYEIRRTRVWVPGRFVDVHRKVWIPGQFKTRRVAHYDHCGNVRYHTETYYVRGHYETVCEQKWVEGHYDIREERVFVPYRDTECEDRGGCR